jgi:hypothetical protein
VVAEQKYGLINSQDAFFIEETLRDIVSDFKGYLPISITEIGLYNCETSIGIKNFIESLGREVKYTGIDNEKDKPIVAPFDMNLIIGNSSEVYNQIPKYSQHMIIVDGDHSFPGAICDFFCYADKLKYDGFFVFHDTAPHIGGFKDWQRRGDREDSDMYISVRKALDKIGVLKNKLSGWRLIVDACDPNDEAGGVVILKKLVK